MTTAVRIIAEAPPRSSLRTDTKAWYRQFWPWFVISLPAVSVLFSVATLVVAVRSADSLVRDDWYDAGMTINREFSREHAAAALDLKATLRVAESGRLELVLDGTAADPVRLDVAMSCPSDALRDQLVELYPVSPRTFASRDPLASTRGHWDVAITPPDSSWRVAGRIELTSSAVLAARH
ncbi:MAG TPA: FixH family protein [Candidatus Limnocylindrales bacterium]|nr:FixH family protein [Candidatus Limnocylindrales bacterium]